MKYFILAIVLLLIICIAAFAWSLRPSRRRNLEAAKKLPAWADSTVAEYKPVDTRSAYTPRTRREPGYHRPEVVRERTGELPKIKNPVTKPEQVTAES